MDEQLKKRLQSFSWRLGMMVLVAAIGFIVDNETALQLPSWLIVILGLVAGEVSKFLNTNK